MSDPQPTELDQRPTTPADSQAPPANTVDLQNFIVPASEVDVTVTHASALEADASPGRPQPTALQEPTAPSNANKQKLEVTVEASTGAVAARPGYVVLGSLATRPNEGNRYTITRLHAEGGLGKVWAASDNDLHREVVLKELKPQQAKQPGSVRRFLKEAQVTGQLEHPNIVPIYELGWRPEDRQPFYTMRFVRGETLAGSLRRYHARRKKGEADPLELPRLLGAFISVANAVAFAHSRGVVHRDLKPGNIALGEFGEVIVLDWGLAKLVGQDDEEASERGIAWSEEVDGHQTLEGSVLGTPGYMAPEQAAGQISQIDRCTDIYSLGAILFEILAGVAPHSGRNTLEIVNQIVQGRIPTARSIEPATPPALNAICSKAMALKPEDRYPTATALAADVERWLADEPVSAWPEPWHLRAARWARKHRTLCASAAAAVVILALSLGAWSWSESRRVAELNATGHDFLVAGQTAFANDDFAEAKVQLVKTLATIGEEPALAELRTDAQRLLGLTDAQLARQAERTKAEENYRKFLTLRDQALFHGTLFTGIDQQANLVAAQIAAKDALGIYLSLDLSAPWQPPKAPYTEEEQARITNGVYELLLLLAETTANSADDKPTTAQVTQALALLDRAASLGIETRAWHLRRANYLTQADDVDGALRERQRAEQVELRTALDCFLVGETAYERGNLDAAIKDFDQALRLEPDHFWAHYFLAVAHLKQGQPRETIAHLSASLSRQPDFAWIYLLRGYAYGEIGDFADSEADFAEAARRGANDYGFLVNRAVTRMRAGRLDEAAIDLQAAISLKPDQYQAHANLAEIHRRRQAFDEGLAEASRAIELSRRVATPYRIRAQIRLAQNDLKAALDDYNDTVKHGEPGSQALADDLVERGRLLARLGQNAEALRSYDAALEIDGEQPEIERLRAEALFSLGRGTEAQAALDRYLDVRKLDPEALRLRGLERALHGNAAGAVADYTRSLELDPQSASTRARRGWAYVNSAQLALADFDAAIKLEPANGDLYNGRGYARALVGRYREAVVDAEEAVRLGPAGKELKEKLAIFTNAACVYAQAAGKAAADLQAEDHAALSEKYETRAIELVKQSMALLPKDVRRAYLQQTLADPAFDLVRHRPAVVKFAEKGVLE
jgi:tetratricopeptide (TPR) repeat protein